MNETKDILPDVHTILLEEAQVRTSAWRECDNSKLPFGKILRGFFIPKDDFIELATYANSHQGSTDPEENVSGFRAYLGMGPNKDTGEIECKLMFVPTMGPEQRDRIEHQSTGASLIYDFTTPCPSQCDEGSPLYELRPSFKGK